MKKILSVLLVVMMFALSMAPAASAAAAEAYDYPVIRIEGTGDTIYAADGTNLAVDDEVLVSNVFGDTENLVNKFVNDTITGGDYEEYSKALYEAIVPAFEGLTLDKNGEVFDGSYPRSNSAPQKNSGYGMRDYKFFYDWRLSPMVQSAQLKDYIDSVVQATGGKKVFIYSRCYGSNILAAYLQQFPEHASENVLRVAYYTSSAEGIDFIGALFSGQLFLDDAAIDNFVNYFLENEGVIEDQNLRTFITTLVTLIDEIKLLGLAAEPLSELVNKVCEYAVPMICRDSFANFPAYWAMVGEEYYEDAISFIYGGVEEEYKGLIEKCDAYYNNVTLKMDDIRDFTDAAGIRTIIVAKYNTPLFPINKGSATQGDGFTSIAKQTFGEAVAADYNKVLSDGFINHLETKDYLSPDHKIDASACRYRDTTWFIKNLYHDNFPWVEDDFFIAVLKNGIDINSTEKYPQYMEYDFTADGNRIFNPVEGLDEVPDSEKSEGILAIFMRWLTSFFNIITQIINGEFSFELGL